MNKQELQRQVKELIISALDLEDMTPDDIETSQPLFKEGLGLDSIDALELGMAIKRSSAWTSTRARTTQRYLPPSKLYPTISQKICPIKTERIFNMATREEISESIKDILVEEFDCERSELKDDVNLFTQLDLDSIDAVDLVVRLQQKTNKRVNPEDFKKIRTFGEVVDVVEKLLNEGK